MQYFGEFTSKEDICREFNIDNFDGLILHAEYECESYDGSARVVYIDGGKFFFVEAYHCSCYGLSGDGDGTLWEPEEITFEMVEKMATDGAGFWKQNTRLVEVLRCIDERHLASDPNEIAMVLALMI
jgi:hypothetical protein